MTHSGASQWEGSDMEYMTKNGNLNVFTIKKPNVKSGFCRKFYKKTDEDTLSHFGDCLNFVRKDNVKIIIGPVSFIDMIKDKQKRILPNILIDKMATKLNVLNNNSLEENRIMILKKLQLVDSHNLSDLFNVLKEIIDDNSIS